MNGDLHDYQKLFDAIDVMVFVISPGGIILACNRAVTTRLGYLKEELLDNHVSVIHPPGSSQEITNVLDSLNYSDETVCNLPLVDKLGRRVEVETRIYKGSWEGQSVLFGFSADASKERGLERKFEAVFDCSPTPMVVSRIEDGLIVEVNAAWSELFGFAKEDITGKTTKALNIWTDIEARDELVNKLKLDGRVINENVTLKTRSGFLLYGQMSAAQLVVDGQHLWVTSFVDHTEQQILEQQLEEIRKLTIASAMNKLNLQLQKNKYITIGADNGV